MWAPIWLTSPLSSPRLVIRIYLHSTEALRVKKTQFIHIMRTIIIDTCLIGIFKQMGFVVSRQSLNTL